MNKNAELKKKETLNIFGRILNTKKKKNEKYN